MKSSNAQRCPTVEQLADCLDPVGDAETSVTLHLEHCDTCREKLTSIAGDPQWWQDAESFLSSIVAGTDSAVAESRVSQRVCALTGYQASGPIDQLAVQEAEQLKRLLAPPSHPELIGSINRYELEQLVGRGGMGLVFRAYDTELNRTVAVKILALHLIAIGSARERFIREARAVASLSHPHIVPIYDVVTDGAVPALVMQFIAGETLQQRISRRGPMQVDDVLQIGIQLADALAMAHGRGLVHRDIKPGNVLLEADGSRALLSDFGLVRALDDATLTHSGLLAGTPDFMSPEQANGHSVDARSDLFSLGSVLYTMLTGHPPFRAPEPMAVLNRICHQPHRAASVADPRIPLEVSQLVDRLLTKDPNRRIASAEVVRDRLRELARAPRRLVSGEPSMMQRARRLTLFTAVVFGLAIAIRSLTPALSDWFQPHSIPTVPRSAALAESRSATLIQPTEEPSNMPATVAAEAAEPTVSSNFAVLNQIDDLLNNLQHEFDAIEQNSLLQKSVTTIEPFKTIDATLHEIDSAISNFERALETIPAN